MTRASIARIRGQEMRDAIRAHDRRMEKLVTQAVAAECEAAKAEGRRPRPAATIVEEVLASVRQ